MRRVGENSLDRALSEYQASRRPLFYTRPVTSKPPSPPPSETPTPTRTRTLLPPLPLQPSRPVRPSSRTIRSPSPIIVSSTPDTSTIRGESQSDTPRPRQTSQSREVLTAARARGDDDASAARNAGVDALVQLANATDYNHRPQ